jgi:predicted aldo/keto reductase-like oxidoreductase
VRAALDGGVTYIDTAYGYHRGFSERLLGKALTDGRRNRIKLATKLPGWGEGDASAWEAKLDESLGRLNTDRVDFYLLHGLRWAGFNEKKDELIAFLENMVKKGKIINPAFSFHDNYEGFKNIIDYYPGWGMAQVQFNFMDVDNQATLAGVRYAGEKNVPIVVMEPLRGGSLATGVPS